VRFYAHACACADVGVWVVVSFCETAVFLENWRERRLRQQGLSCHTIHIKWKLYIRIRGNIYVFLYMNNWSVYLGEIYYLQA
jgi:hypothetical protein